MLEKFVVGYDGSETARRALDFAVARATVQNGSIVLVHVLEWSPYSFLTPTELEERHMRRRQEMERAEAAVMAPVIKELTAQGVNVTPVMRYGKTADILCAVAREESAVQIFVGREGHSALEARLFGSVAGALVQTAPVPCTIVP
ncbi:universal stress protein [Roseinatronobacter alkalisoli]|uniref:Universal stress protein n=1 Tax=Roseinatronobacter alkalisoli TaxID=3028235 RepID=A0ABT5TFD1_9RHOB|nr:universal stress protein [Roseinatronobacter sp. HJB301]MDD7973081.1 universal stress protein [Roseinatronobacter sp. HJB301]